MLNRAEQSRAEQQQIDRHHSAVRVNPPGDGDEEEEGKEIST